MGLGNRTNKTYLKILFGKVCMASTKDDPNATERVNKNNDTVYERYYDYIEGVVTGIKREKSNNESYPDRYCIDINDGTDDYTLQFPVDGRDALAFLKASPNVDFEKTVRFVPWEQEKDGVKRSGLMLIQNNQKVDWAYTKENQNGLPEPEQKKFKGKMQWDFFPQFEFLDKMLHDDIIPKISTLPPSDDTGVESQTKETTLGGPENTTLNSSDDDSDLPF
jgi:hypothetical protein